MWVTEKFVSVISVFASWHLFSYICSVGVTLPVGDPSSGYPSTVQIQSCLHWSSESWFAPVTLKHTLAAAYEAHTSLYRLDIGGILGLGPAKWVH